MDSATHQFGVNKAYNRGLEDAAMIIRDVERMDPWLQHRLIYLILGLRTSLYDPEVNGG